VRTAAQVKGEKSQADAKAKEREIKDKEREVWEALRRVEDEEGMRKGGGRRIASREGFPPPVFIFICF